MMPDFTQEVREIRLLTGCDLSNPRAAEIVNAAIADRLVDAWRAGLEQGAVVVERWPLPTIQTPSMWLIDKAAIAAAIRAEAGEDGP